MRFVTWNFLAGGSRNRAGHWSRLVRRLDADIVFAQECRAPADSALEPYRPDAGDGLLWRAASPAGWGSALLVRAACLSPIELPLHDGWIVGGELPPAAWSDRPLRLFSVHGPVGNHGYIRTLHEILDAIAPLARDADLVLGGDFNVVVGYRQPREKLRVSRAERAILERLAGEFGLLSCWQVAHPDRPLAQTLRWTADRKTPYHCDGIFVPATWRDRLIACRVVRGSRWDQLSDHNPVLAEFATA